MVSNGHVCHINICLTRPYDEPLTICAFRWRGNRGMTELYRCEIDIVACEFVRPPVFTVFPRPGLDIIRYANLDRVAELRLC